MKSRTINKYSSLTGEVRQPFKTYLDCLHKVNDDDDRKQTEPMQEPDRDSGGIVAVRDSDVVTGWRLESLGR